MQTIKYKLIHPKAVPPVKASKQAAGWDLTAVSFTGSSLGTFLYDFGIAFEIPEGWCGIMCARSSSYTRGLVAVSGVGVIDADYRGSVHMAFAKISSEYSQIYQPGDRAAQILFVPLNNIAGCNVELLATTELSETKRNFSGFGSTGV